MAGADGGAGPGAGPEWRWDVALSFAGAQRNYVEQVAGALTALGVRCFYDADEQIELWGKYLAEELPTIYGEQAAAVVVFVSAEYASRDWTRLERRAALNRAVRERQECVLPARFDDTPLPGLLSDMVAIDLRTRTPQQFADMIAAKLAALGIVLPALTEDRDREDTGSTPGGQQPLGDQFGHIPRRSPQPRRGGLPLQAPPSPSAPVPPSHLDPAISDPDGLTTQGQRAEGLDEPRSLLRAQIWLIVAGIPGVQEGLEDAAVYPPDWAERIAADYLYRERALLVRTVDVDRVRAIVGGALVQHHSAVRGLTRLEVSEDESRSVEELCAAIDRALDEGVATPDHILHICTYTAGPATEPEAVPPDAPPDPGVSAEGDDGQGVLVAVLDTGLLPAADVEHAWLAWVRGEMENPISGYPPRILPRAGHGTFAAGVARTMAPSAEVSVHRTSATLGAVYESDLVRQVSDTVKMGAEVISLSFGTHSRHDIPLLGFEVLEERLRNYPAVVLVAPAGNDSSRHPFWPAAFPWLVGVGSLNADLDGKASWSNYGPWVDVFAPGERLVNAFAKGDYLCTEPPHVGTWRKFDGMARWSGTSFSTPLVAGLIAARISATGENGRQAAEALLARARTQAIRGVGPVILPGQARDW